MANPIVYTSADTGAPVLQGYSSEYEGLLTACLVTGYSSKAAAGWSKVFSEPQTAVFRAPAGVRHYWKVEDSLLSGSTHYARLYGYETMSDIHTGTGRFPTAAQRPNGLHHYYVNAAVARPWVVIADDRSAYIFTDPAGDQKYYGVHIGEILALNDTDTFRSLLVGGDSDAPTRDNLSILGHSSNVIGQTTNGHYMPRSYTGSGTALLVGKHSDNVYQIGASDGSGGFTITTGSLPQPNPTDGKLRLGEIWIHEILQPTTRGKLRGMWLWPHPANSVGDRDTFLGEGIFAGKSFLVIRQGFNGAIYIIETSEWPRNP